MILIIACTLLFCIFFSIVLLKTFYPNLNALTGLDDLVRLGTHPVRQQKKYKHAVVCGGSFAGILSARILLDHFERVTIIDKDDLNAIVNSDQPQARDCVPQQHYAHITNHLLTATLEKVFPGVVDYYASKGARIVDYGDFHWFFHVGWFWKGKSGRSVVWATRPLLEHGIRKFLYKAYSSRITTLQGSVTGLIASDGETVQGVYVRLKNGGSDVTEVAADFVVDSTGRACKGAKWLKEIGYEEPPYDTYDAYVSYASRLYNRPKDVAEGKCICLVFESPKVGTKNALIAEVEEQQVLVTFMGLSKDTPSSENFEEWSTGLVQPDIHDMLLTMQPKTAVQCYKPGKSKILFYDKVKTPTNFVAVGDSIAHFNPTYAQGLACTAMGASTLDSVFRECADLKNISKRYFGKMKWRLLIPWNSPKALDQQYPLTFPKQWSVMSAVLSRAVPVLLKTACHSKYAHEKFINFLSMSTSILDTLDIFLFWEIVRWTVFN